jgi:4-hydroxy-2-oxoheptanedioate aldolase
MSDMFDPAGKGPSFGAWVSLGDPISTELMGKAGYDWLIFDLQHGAVSWERLLTAMQAVDLGRTPAFVRTPWNSPDQLMRAMDLGARGVVVPMVSTAEQARLAAQAVHYSPRGVRSFGPVRSAYLEPGAPSPEPVCMVMIETAEAMENLDAIAATPGLGGLFVGPVDLAFSLGIGPGFDVPAPVLDACERVVEACARHNLIPGCAGMGTAHIEQMLDRGMRFLTLGGDAGHVRRGAMADVEQARAWRVRKPTPR